jgi:hypothetical protein
VYACQPGRRAIPLAQFGTPLIQFGIMVYLQ